MNMVVLSSFEARVGEEFEFCQHLDGTLHGAMQLLAAEARHVIKEGDAGIADTSGQFRKEPFSLAFSSEHEPYLPQGTYHVMGPGDKGEVLCR